MHSLFLTLVLMQVSSDGTQPQPQPQPSSEKLISGEKEGAVSSVIPERPPPSDWDREQAKRPGRIPEEEVSFLSQLSQTLLVLLVITGVIYLLGKLASNRLSHLKLYGAKGKRVSVLERVALDSKNALYVVEIDDRETLLLGGGEKGVSLVTRLASAKPAPAVSFGDRLEEAAEASEQAQENVPEEQDAHVA